MLYVIALQRWLGLPIHMASAANVAAAETLGDECAMSDLRCLLADLPYRIVTRAQPISDDERCPHIATQGLPLQDACDVGAHIVQDIRPSFRRMGYLASSPSCGFNKHMHICTCACTCISACTCTRSFAHSCTCHKHHARPCSFAAHHASPVSIPNCAAASSG